MKEPLTDEEWGKFGYLSNEPCDICGGTPTKTEPRFLYATCRKHGHIPPTKRVEYKRIWGLGLPNPTTKAIRTNFDRLQAVDNPYDMADIILNQLSLNYGEIIKRDGTINGLPLLHWLQEEVKE